MADLRELLKAGRRLEVTNPETGAVVRWTIQGLLQEGGRGLVFEVADPDGRPAVLKGPSRAPGAAYSAIIEREILKKVSPHPSLVKYLGSSDEGGMPLVIVGWAHENPFLRLNASPARENAAAWRDPQVPGVGLPAPVAIEIVFDLVLALEHLHTNGFVHSDVKPANVMVEVDPTARDLDDADFFRAVAEGRTRAVLIDVGGARSESFLEDLNSGNVDPSIVPPELTPLWAPPEAVVGAETREGRRPIYSAAIDVYQAGLLLGVLLTGRAPYEHLADRYDRNDLAQLMELKAAERRGELSPFPPGAVRTAPQDDVSWEVDGRSGRPGFDDAVDAILMHTLARDAKERGTIGQLRMTMERAFDLFPNARARGGAVVAPTFRARGRVAVKVENRLTAAATKGARSGMGSQIPADAAAQVLKMAAEVANPRGTVVRAAPPPRPTGSVAKLAPKPAGPPLKPATTSQPSKPTGTTARPAMPPATSPGGPESPQAARFELDRVLLRVNPKDATKAFEVLSREGARSIEVEGGRFEFRIAPTRACEVLRAALDAKVDVFVFERRKSGPPTGKV